MMYDVAVVTGAAGGIGAAICKKLAQMGWRVVGIDRTWRSSHGRDIAVTETVNVTDYAAVEQGVHRIEESFGAVGLLVNNAGITHDSMCHRMEPRDFVKVLEVNLIGPFHTCRALLPAMRKRSFGRLINISSMNALRGQAGQANYVASKAGLIALTKSIALENASKGITANCIAPGFIETDMTAAMPPHVRATELASIPVGRIGTPADVANAVAFLASDSAAFVTGQVLSINGGQLMP